MQLNIQDRIKSFERVAARKLSANPKNWRKHPAVQRDAMTSVLQEIGFAGAVIAYRQNKELVIIDGHLRVDITDPDALIPVLILDVDEKEAEKILATYDKVSELAKVDEEKIRDLYSNIEFNAATLEEIKKQVLEVKKEEEELQHDIHPVYSTDEVVDDAFTHFRSFESFPLRPMPVFKQKLELNNLATTPTEKLKNSKYGYSVANSYHPHRLAARVDAKITPIEAFNDDDKLKHACRLAVEQNNIGVQELSTLSFVRGAQAAANFRPAFALLLYREFTNSKSVVLDTSTGYGGRLVGFMASHAARYIGIDPCVATYNGNKTMAENLGFSESVKLINKPAEDVTLDDIGEQVDFSFTSPPYFSREQYSDEETQSWKRYKTGDDWRDGFLVPMMQLQHDALKKGGTVIINIADVMIKRRVYPLVEWTKSAGESAGLTFIEERQFPLSRVPGRGSDVRADMPFEPVLVFKKA